ncbi:hypothetical protein THI4931_26190 [Pandoraea sputorum]|nr:hypothetical protein THI4931_26190 [Pandoraea sputorum]
MNRDPTEGKRGGVADHVPGVGQQCERAGQQPADDLDDHEDGDDDERDPNPLLIGDATGMAMTGMTVPGVAM